MSIWAPEWLPASSKHQICQPSNSINVLQAGQQILLNFKCWLTYRFWISSQHTVTSQKTQVLFTFFPDDIVLWPQISESRSSKTNQPMTSSRCSQTLSSFLQPIPPSRFSLNISKFCTDQWCLPSIKQDCAEF